jgi:hypothetical protein
MIAPKSKLLAWKLVDAKLLFTGICAHTVITAFEQTPTLFNSGFGIFCLGNSMLSLLKSSNFYRPQDSVKYDTCVLQNISVQKY